MLNGVAPLYVNFLVAGTVMIEMQKYFPHTGICILKISVLGHRAVEELKIWKREVKKTKTKTQESITHFAHLNVPSSLEFISNEHFFSGRISPGSLFLTAPPNVCTCIFLPCS